jgi:myo-inositol-1(or 4)-monophosphatase
MKNLPSEMHKFRQIAIKASLEAGEILLRKQPRKKDVGYKGEVNLVTEVDLLSERTILKTIDKSFPEHSILTEETIGQKKDSPYCWIIDPLDGTTNYVHNFPVYCVSIALQKDKETVLGVVYNPLLKELFLAEKGKGAFLNGKRIFVSNTKKLSQSLLATGFPYDIRTSKENNLDYFSKFALKAQAIRRAGSAALDLCYLAMGRFDGFWELKLSPWDTAAGVLMITAAGGKVTNFSNGKFDIFCKDLLATNGKIHKQMLDVLNQ